MAKLTSQTGEVKGRPLLASVLTILLLAAIGTATACTNDRASNRAEAPDSTAVTTLPEPSSTSATASTIPLPTCEAWAQLRVAGPDSYPSDRGYPDEAAAAAAQLYDEFGVALDELIVVASDQVRPVAEELQTSLEALMADPRANGSPGVMGMKQLEPQIQRLWVWVHKECPDADI